MSEPVVWYVATCLDCDPRLPQPFRDYEERARWVGEHRVGTGHFVEMTMETR